ncbi:MAG: DUF1232 domain-containing protein [Victivallales bacterium]|nr:DUF1232 domain-containing protein [Victivallales bacterium]MBR4613272.1 DUF1232 domain-containing protein [Kiritimatiellia bacterium]
MKQKNTLINEERNNFTAEQQNKIHQELGKAKEFSRDELGEVVKKESKAFALATRLPAGFFSKVKLAAGLLKDYAKGNYREIPWNTIAYLGFGIAYLVSPIDVIPDFIPVAGLADDAALLALIFKGISDDLDDYAAWKARQGQSGRGDSGSQAA